MCSRAQSLRAAASAEQDRLRAQWQLEMEIREKRALQVWAGVGVGVGGGYPVHPRLWAGAWEAARRACVCSPPPCSSVRVETAHKVFLCPRAT